MSVVEIRYTCDDCHTHFSLSGHDIHAAARAHCPGCGSLHIQRSRGTRVVFPERLHTPIRTPSTDQNLKVPKQRSAAAGARKKRNAEKQARLLSSPTAYRLTCLRNNHHRLKTIRAKAAAKAEAARRADFDPSSLK